jgi:hypothetical protein
VEAAAGVVGLGLPAGICVGVGVPVVAVADSDGAGAGVRGRGGKRIQLSMSVTGPWAKLGSDKLAEIAKASAVLAPSCAKLTGIACHEDLPLCPCMGVVPFL